MINIKLDAIVLNFKNGYDVWTEDLPNYRSRDLVNPYIDIDVELSGDNKKIFCLKNILLYCHVSYLAGRVDFDEIIKESEFGKMKPGDEFTIFGPVYTAKGTEYPFDTYLYRIANKEKVEENKEWISGQWVSEEKIRNIELLLVPWNCAIIKK